MMGMSNEQVLDFNNSIIAEFRANGGVMPETSLMHGNPTLLLTSIGAKSGRELTSPLSYANDNDGWIIMASAGGSEKTPSWAYNLRANPEVTIELLDETFAATATETHMADRDHAFAVMTTALPRFAEYQDRVERVIPLFRITRR